METKLILTAIVLATLIMLMVRNNQVYKTRMKVLKEIYTLMQRVDNVKGYDWRKRATLYDEISYTRQVIMFWTNIRSHWNPKMWEEKL